MTKKTIWGAAILAVMAGPLYAQDGQISPIQFNMNTLFLIICGILVMWMSAGFAMVEAGFVRAKNVVNQCAKNIGLVAIASICFLVFGYGLMFPGDNWIIPGVLGHSGMVTIGDVADTGADFGAKSHADGSIVFFQMMFCAAVASIVSGSLAERMKLLPFFLFTILMTGIIYPLQASWVWGGGFLDTQYGFKDLAGSASIHVVGGVAALTGSIALGARAGRYVDGVKVPMTSFNLPIATLGALILWMGWFGFNAGSYLSFSSEPDASNVARILLNTNMAAAGGVITAAFVSYLQYYRFDLSFMINGGLAGLVAITAEPLFPTPVLAIAIGMVGGLVVFWALQMLEALKIDDVVGAIPVHLFAGIWGTIAVVLSNPDATLMGQVIGLAVIIAYVAVSTTFIWTILKVSIGIRVSAENEEVGVDQSELVTAI
ncbi:MAG: ammonium transporter [Aliishimia sp.]